MERKSTTVVLAVCFLATVTASIPAGNGKLSGGHSKSGHLGYHRPDYHGITYQDGIPVYGEERSFYGPHYFQGQGHQAKGLHYEEIDNGQNPLDLHQLFQVPNQHQYPIYHETPKEHGMSLRLCVWPDAFTEIKGYMQTIIPMRIWQNSDPRPKKSVKCKNTLPSEFLILVCPTPYI